MLLTGATVVPVSFGVAHGYPDVETWQAVAPGHEPGYIYARNTNPTVEAFERKIGVLEQAEDATSFSTGMAAISNTLFALLEPDDRRQRQGHVRWNQSDSPEHASTLGSPEERAAMGIPEG